MPVISIVMPNYNAEKYIKQTITSILNQTFTDFELLVVDDGSTDHSRDIVQELMNQDSRITLITQANDGAPGKARNEGFRMSKGEVVVFFDSDDMMEPTYLETMYNKLQSEDLDLVIANINFYDVFKKTYVTNEMSWFFNNEPHELTDLFRIAPLPINKMYRKSFLERTNVTYMTKIFNQDMGFFISNLFYFPKFAVINEVLCTYMIRENSITTGEKTRKRHIESLKVYDQVLAEWKKTGSSDYFRKEVYKRMIRIMNYKASFFNMLTDKEYLNQLADYLNTNFPNWDKSEELKEQYSLMKRIYTILLFKYRMFFVIGLYKKFKGSGR